MTRALSWARRHVWVAWLLCLPVLWQAVDWVLDRHPPFSFIGAPSVVSARAGQSAVYVVRVRRDLDRDCSVRWQRYIIDSQAVRHDFAGRFELAPEALRQMAAAMGPEWLRVAVEVPVGAASGRAQVVTTLLYVCNPIHEHWPIAVTTVLPLEVLP